MKKNKKIEPGKTFTVKVPVDADEKTLGFLNRDRDISRNKLVYWILEREAKIEDGKEISLPLSFELSDSEKEKILEPNTVRSIEAFIKALIGKQEHELVNSVEIPEVEEVSAADIAGLMDFE